MKKNLYKKELFRIDEVAEYFGVHKKTVYAWIKAGVLNFIKVGGTIRISRASIVEKITRPE